MEEIINNCEMTVEILDEVKDLQEIRSIVYSNISKMEEKVTCLYEELQDIDEKLEEIKEKCPHDECFVTPIHKNYLLVECVICGKTFNIYSSDTKFSKYARMIND